MNFSLIDPVKLFLQKTVDFIKLFLQKKELIGKFKTFSLITVPDIICWF